MPTQIRLKKKPLANQLLEWEVTQSECPEISEGQVKLRVEYISIDPGMMGWIAAKKSYMPAINEGDVMRAFGVGEVVESRSEKFAVGDFAAGFTGVQTEAVAGPMSLLRAVDPKAAPLSHYLSGLGWPAFTGYFGMTDIGQPQSGETVVVSGAAGAVGSIACQVAKIAGARVIGIAGGEKKCSLLTERYGVDAAIDYKRQPVAEGLQAHCPDGIDIYFDNVGGETLDAAIYQMKYKGRLVICGAISQYENMDGAVGPRNYMQLVSHSLRMQGYTMKDYFRRIPEAERALGEWFAAGKLEFEEHILDGIESFPEAFKMIFAGKNFGKLMIKV